MSQAAGAKRPSSDDNTNREMKRHKTDEDVTLRILLQSKNAGGIIGKGGQTIKRLRSEYSASVNVPDSNSNERVLSIQAGEETCLNIIRECLQLCGSAPHPSSGGKREVEVEINFLVHSSQVGSVIGKGGFRIKEIREKTGAVLKVMSDCLPNSTERVVAIGGGEDELISALKAVLDIMAETPIRGPVTLYDPSMTGGDYNVYQPYGGGVPRGDNYGPDGGRGGPGGGRGGYGRGGGGGSSFGGPPRPGPPPMGGPPPMDGGNFGPPIGGGGGEKGFEFEETVQTTQVTIPKDLAGAVIGKGGERIRNIRQRSGADIKIDEPLPSQNDRIISITGVQSQINYAQYLMQQSVRMYSGKNY